MGAFDDSADAELGAACNRLAAWVEPLPAGELRTELLDVDEITIAPDDPPPP